ncbi:hypothetical protein AUJ84_02460 [Candidatus Pacearchaeota archaeon CG1_02_32_132]|nr:MAG: hypothetical protein AUJ84_02460 [Candidatus Pacearchaeota archaeon CG1_02_32_132]
MLKKRRLNFIKIFGVLTLVFLFSLLIYMVFHIDKPNYMLSPDNQRELEWPVPAQGYDWTNFLNNCGNLIDTSQGQCGSGICEEENVKCEPNIPSVRLCVEPLTNYNLPVPFGKHAFLRIQPCGSENTYVAEDVGRPDDSSNCPLAGKARLMFNEDNTERNREECENVIIPDTYPSCQFTSDMYCISNELSMNYDSVWDLLGSNCGGYAQFLINCLGGKSPSNPNMGIGCNFKQRPFFERANPNVKLSSDEVCKNIKKSCNIDLKEYGDLFDSKCKGGCCKIPNTECKYCKDGGPFEKPGSKAKLKLNLYKAECRTDSNCENPTFTYKRIAWREIKLQKTSTCGTWQTNGGSGYGTCQDNVWVNKLPISEPNDIPHWEYGHNSFSNGFVPGEVWECGCPQDLLIQDVKYEQSCNNFVEKRAVVRGLGAPFVTTAEIFVDSKNIDACFANSEDIAN